jgi:hypothetical protein
MFRQVAVISLWTMNCSAALQTSHALEDYEDHRLMFERQLLLCIPIPGEAHWVPSVSTALIAVNRRQQVASMEAMVPTAAAAAAAAATPGVSSAPSPSVQPPPAPTSSATKRTAGRLGDDEPHTRV